MKPLLPEPHYSLANALNGKGEVAEAIASLERFVRLRPNFVDGLAQLSYLRTQACDWRDYDADEANSGSLRTLAWAPFGRPETGWDIYVPLIQSEIRSACPGDSEGFAAALAAWQASQKLDGNGVLTEPVSAIHTTQVRTVEPDAALEDVERLMTEHRFRHVPVVIDGTLRGVVSIGDVVKNRIDELEAERSSLAGYITGERDHP